MTRQHRFAVAFLFSIVVPFTMGFITARNEWPIAPLIVVCLLSGIVSSMVQNRA